MADFAEKLAKLMKEKEFSGNALAKKSGVPQTTISGYMRRENRPSWEHVQRLAIALGVSCTDLTDDAPEVTILPTATHAHTVTLVPVEPPAEKKAKPKKPKKLKE